MAGDAVRIINASAPIFAYGAAAELTLNGNVLTSSVLCPINRSVCEYGNLLIFFDGIYCDILCAGNFFYGCCIEAATEICFKEFIYSVDSTSVVSTNEVDLRVNCLNNEAVVAKFFSVKLTGGFTCGLTYDDFVICLCSAIGSNRNLATGYLLDVGLELDCSIEFSFC